MRGGGISSAKTTLMAVSCIFQGGTAPITVFSTFSARTAADNPCLRMPSESGRAKLRKMPNILFDIAASVRYIIRERRVLR